MEYPAESFKSVYQGNYKALGPSYAGPIPKTWLLKFYIPPAVKGRVSIALFCVQNATVGVVARLGAPPQCSLEAYKSNEVSDKYYMSLNFDNNKGVLPTLAQLRERDYRLKHIGGTLPICKDYAPSSTGEWLFVMVLFAGKGIANLAGCQSTIDVDRPAYDAWVKGVVGDPPLIIQPLSRGTCDFKSEVVDAPVEPKPEVPGSGTGYGDIFDNLLPPKPKPPAEDFAYQADSQWPLYQIPFDALVKGLPIKFNEITDKECSFYVGYKDRESVYLLNQTKRDIYGHCIFDKYCNGDPLPICFSSIGTGQPWRCMSFSEATVEGMVGKTIYVGAMLNGNSETFQGARFQIVEG